MKMTDHSLSHKPTSTKMVRISSKRGLYIYIYRNDGVQIGVGFPYPTDVRILVTCGLGYFHQVWEK